jgi:peptidoglycan/LPS O-acetylase OafA/YrhL
VDSDRRVLVAAYVVFLLLGVMLGVWGAFLVPLRLVGGVEGLADVVGFAGPAAAGYLGAVGIGNGPLAVMPGIGWILAVLVLSMGRGGDVVIPGSLGPDPGVAHVGTIYLLSGMVGTLVAGVLAGRKLRR